MRSKFWLNLFAVSILVLGCSDDNTNSEQNDAGSQSSGEQPGTSEQPGTTNNPDNGNPGGTTDDAGNDNPGGTTDDPGNGNPGGTTDAPGNDNPGGKTDAPGNDNPGGTTDNPGNDNPGGKTDNPGNDNPGGTTGEPEQPGDINIDDDKFDESLLEGARLLSKNVIHIYRKSSADADYGKNIKFFDMSALDSKQKSSEFVKTGSASAKWTCEGEGCRFYFFKDDGPKDISAYKAMAFWMYVPEKSVGASFYVYFSTAKGTLSKVSYRKQVKMEKAGWNYVALDFKTFGTDGTPAGTDQIYSFLLYEDWNNRSHMPFTVYIDDVYLFTDIKDAGLTDGVLPAAQDGALFAMNGSRAVIENQLIKTSFKNDDSIVYQDGKYPIYQKDKEIWLPLSVIGARYDKNAVYNDNSHVLKMKLNGKTYIYQAGKDRVLIDGKYAKLDFEVGLNGDALFVPVSYIKTLMNYKNVYYDDMGMVYLYNKDVPLKDYSFEQRLAVSFEMLFTRPSGEEVLAAVTGKGHPRVLVRQSDFDRIKQLYDKGDAILHEDYDKYFVPMWGVNSNKFKNETREDDYLLSLMIWGGMYKINGDKKFVERIWTNVENVCKSSSWWSSSTSAAASIVFFISIAYDWLYNEWTDEQRKIMETAVLDKWLKADSDQDGITNIDYYYTKQSHNVTNNHNATDNGGFMVASIAFADVPEIRPYVAKIMDNAMRNVETGLFQYAPDGGYIDSTQYWHIGTRYLYYMMSTLDAAAGTNYGLFYSPGFAQSAFMPTYMENAAGTWMYHDPSGNARFVNTEVLPWFAKKLHDPRIGYLRRRSLEQTPSFHAPAPELLWHDSDLVANSINIPYDAHYDFLGTMVMHSSWEKNSIMTGIHGGINSRGSDHGDWDIGNFIIFAGEQQFLIELGIDSYSITNYFGKDRQKLYRKRAEGQNTLVIGDVSQDEPDQISGAFSPLLRTESNDRGAIGIIDMAPAYEQVTEGKRGLFFKDNRSVVVVQDEMKLSSSEIIRWSAHTMHTIDIAADGRSATLCTNDKDGKPLPCLYAEIVSSDNTLKFTSGDAQSFVPNYTKLEHELSLDGIHKLMIITDKKVNTLNLAVAFKVIQPDEKVSRGTIYQWTNMAQWKLQ